MAKSPCLTDSQGHIIRAPTVGSCINQRLDFYTVSLTCCWRRLSPALGYGLWAMVTAAEVGLPVALSSAGPPGSALVHTVHLALVSLVTVANEKYSRVTDCF